MRLYHAIKFWGIAQFLGHLWAIVFTTAPQTSHSYVYMCILILESISDYSLPLFLVNPLEGRDTAGLGGIGGLFRLDADHDVHLWID